VIAWAMRKRSRKWKAKTGSRGVTLGKACHLDESCAHREQCYALSIPRSGGGGGGGGGSDVTNNRRARSASHRATKFRRFWLALSHVTTHQQRESNP